MPDTPTKEALRLQAYRALYSHLVDMLAHERLTEKHIPDDYAKLTEAVVKAGIFDPDELIRIVSNERARR